MKRSAKRRRLVTVFPHPQGAEIVDLRLGSGHWEAVGHTAIHTPDKWDGKAVGDVLREALKASGIHTRDALLCLPGEWCSILRIRIPTAAAEDCRGFISLQAEAMLPFGAEDTAFAWKQLRETGDGESRAVVIGTRRSTIALWEDALKHSGLRLSDTVPGLPPIRDAGEEVPFSIAATERGTYLSAGNAGCPILWRRISPPLSEQCIEDEVPNVFREVRLALAELPPGERPRQIDIFASTAQQEVLVEAAAAEKSRHRLPDLRPGARDENVLLHMACQAAEFHQDVQGLTFAPLTVAKSGMSPVRRVLLCAASFAFVLVLLSISFWWHQSLRLHDLQARHAAIAPALAVADSLREQVRTLTPWFERDPVELRILNDIAQAFPETGSVYATHLNIKDNREISLSGVAVNGREWLSLQERLCNLPRVADLRVSQTRAASGKQELSFTLQFTWKKGH